MTALEDRQAMVAQAAQCAEEGLKDGQVVTGVVVVYFGPVAPGTFCAAGFSVKDHTKVEVVRARASEVLLQDLSEGQVATRDPGETVQ